MEMWIGFRNLRLGNRIFFRQHVLVWHPSMQPPFVGYVHRQRDNLARSARHPLLGAIQHRGVRALWVVEQLHAITAQPHESWLIGAPCVWCGQLSDMMCSGVPPSTFAPGWRCEFPICLYCEALYERCSFCCRWTGLPVQASALAKELRQTSTSVLGALAREYQNLRRIPFESMPTALRQACVKFFHDYPCCGDRQHFESVQESGAFWFKMMARHYLREDAPAEQRLPPPLDTERLLESDENPEEDFMYVPRGHSIFEAAFV